MRFSTRDTSLRSLDVPLLVVTLAKGDPLDDQLRGLDDTLGGALSRVIDRRDFRAGRDEMMHFVGGTKGPQHVLLVGLGGVTQTPVAIRRAAMIAARFARRTGAREIAWYDGDGAPNVENAVIGLSMGAWEYTETRSPPPDDERRATPEEVTIVVKDEKRARSDVASGVAIAEGYALARRLAMMPGNFCTPDYLAQTAVDLGKRHGLKVTVFGRKEMEARKRWDPSSPSPRARRKIPSS